MSLLMIMFSLESPLTGLGQSGTLRKHNHLKSCFISIPLKDNKHFYFTHKKHASYDVLLIEYFVPIANELLLNKSAICDTHGIFNCKYLLSITYIILLCKSNATSYPQVFLHNFFRVGIIGGWKNI